MSALQCLSKSATERVRSIRYENPVVTKELRTRMRGAKAYWIMAGYVILLALFLLIQYYSEWINQGQAMDPRSWQSARLGFQLFSNMTWAQAIFIAFLAPAVTSGSITIEREQQTIEMLALTPMSPRNIVAGKVMAPMLFILMLLGSSLPLAGLCVMFGSISPLEVAVVYAMLIGWAFLFSAAGVFFSSALKRTVNASLSTFGTVVVFVIAITAATFALNQTYLGHYASGWTFIFSGLTALTAADYAMNFASVLGLKLPVALIALLFDAAMGVLLLTLALTKLAFYREKKPALIRSLLLGITVIGAFLFFANMSDSPHSFKDGNDFATFILFFVPIFVMAMIPAFCTGALKTTQPIRQLFTGNILKKPFSLTPTGGLWFIVMWFVLGCGAALSVMAFHNTTTRSLTQPDWPMVIHASAAFLAAIVGMGAVGILFSTIFRNRQWAAGVTLLFVICAWAVYPIVAAQYTSGQAAIWSGLHGVTWNATYLWPGVTLDALSGSWTPGVNAARTLMPAHTVWIGCVIAWSIVTIIAMSLANALAMKNRGVQEE